MKILMVSAEATPCAKTGGLLMLKPLKIFCSIRSALSLCKAINWIPDVIHSHDWAAGLTSVLLKCFESSVCCGWFRGILVPKRSLKRYPDACVVVRLLEFEPLAIFCKIPVSKYWRSITIVPAYAAISIQNYYFCSILTYFNWQTCRSFK